MEEEKNILNKTETINPKKKDNQKLKDIFKHNIKKGLFYEFYWSLIYYIIQFFCFFYKSKIIRFNFILSRFYFRT